MSSFEPFWRMNSYVHTVSWAKAGLQFVLQILSVHAWGRTKTLKETLKSFSQLLPNWVKQP